MIRICILSVCCCTIVFSVRTTLDASGCHLDLTYEAGPQISGTVSDSTRAIWGRPGKHGPPGPRGMKGEKGDACENRQLLEPGCPQTKYFFPNSGQTKDYIRVKTPFESSPEYTVCSWLTPLSGRWKDTSYFSYATASSANEFLLYFDTSGKFHPYASGEGHAMLLHIDQRVHLCIVINKPRATIYENGVLKETLTYTNTNPIQGGGALIIGQEQDKLLGGFDTDQALTGTVENMMVWYRSLSSGEIRNLYANPCNCPTDYAVALTLDAVQLVGGVLAQPIDQC